MQYLHDVDDRLFPDPPNTTRWPARVVKFLVGLDRSPSEASIGLHWWKERYGSGEVSPFNDLPVIFLPAHMGQRCLRVVAILSIIKRRLMIRERSVSTGSVRHVHAHHG
jgi:hypothetical protein